MRRGARAVLLLWAAAAGASPLTSRSLHEGKTVLEGHEGGAAAVSYSPDGRTLISAGADRRLKVWDVAVAETASLLAEAKAHESPVYAAAFSPDGSAWATAGYDKTLRVWDAATRAPRKVAATRAALFALAWSPDGKSLACAGDEGAVRVVDSDGSRVWELRHGAPLRALAWSKEGLIAAGAEDGGLSLWAPGRSVKEPAARLALAHAGGVTAAAFSPDGKVLVTAGADRALRVWSLPDLRLTSIFRGHLSPPTSLAFFSDGLTLVSGGPDKARFWDVETGIEKRLLRAPDEGAVAVSISPDGTTLASGNSDGTVRLYLLVGADERRALSAPPPPKRRPSRRI